LELGWWESRGCNTAIISLEGQKGVSEARITEVSPGKTLPAQRYAFAEVVYVLNGHGMTTMWDDHGRRRTFEWQPRSLFCLPRHCHHQVANARGDRPARLLHYNYLPMAMSAIPEPEFFFDNPFAAASPLVGLEESFSEAKVLVDPDEEGGRWRGGRAVWAGNFFPDMQAWDKLIPYRGRGAGGRVVWIQFPRAEMGAHMSVFDSQKYKKGHKHGPGRVIVIPKGEGYSVLWPEGGEKIVCPWKEATIFVPPENWYHQHFNVTGKRATWLLARRPSSEELTIDIRSSIQTRIPGSARSFRPNWPNMGSRVSCPTNAIKTGISSGITVTMTKTKGSCLLLAL
jgi:oxalate decarboxylase/phosphoglucose isomerase-like protein (cupin superfamily)